MREESCNLFKKRPLKLNLGCGNTNIDGFVNIDIFPAEHVHIVCDITRLEFLEESTVDLIYASHVLEHFGRWQCQVVLNEWTRLLRRGGILRVAVPNFAACVDHYQEHGLEDGLSGLIGLISGGQRNEFDFHKSIFDEAYLSNLLQEAGLTDVAWWDWRTTEHAAHDDYSQAYLPHLDKQNGRLMSLNLEARKP